MIVCYAPYVIRDAAFSSTNQPVVDATFAFFVLNVRDIFQTTDQIDHDLDQVDHDLDQVDPNLPMWVGDLDPKHAVMSRSAVSV